jgi:group I intron endonuclease
MSEIESNYINMKNINTIRKLFPANGLFFFKGSEIMFQKILLKNKSGVYALFNTVSGKYYIGSSRYLWNRIIDYSQPYFLKKLAHLPIAKAIYNYRFNNLTVVILEYTAKDKTIRREQKYIDLYRPEYNVLKFAHSSKGRMHCEERKM